LLRVVARNCMSLRAFKSARVRAMARVLPKLLSLRLDLSEGLLNLTFDFINATTLSVQTILIQNDMQWCLRC